MKKKYQFAYLFLLITLIPYSLLSGLIFEPGETISFGRLKKGETAVRTITVYNTDRSPVVINRIYGDCSCITYEISEKVIPAYGETGIVLKFNSTDEPAGAFSKTIFISYAGGEKKIMAAGEVLVPDTAVPVKLNIESKSSSLSNGDDSDSSADASAEAVMPVSHVYPVYIAYFYTPGCGDCAMAKKIIRNTSKNFPDIIVKEYDTLLRDNRVLLEGLADVYCLAENDSIAPPVVFISCSSGKKYLQGRDISVPALEKIAVNCNKENIVSYIAPWDMITASERISASKKIKNRFENLRIMPILFAGLTDGINPCAFGVIIFFITYATMILKKTRYELLGIGINFVAGVFIAYFLMGIGIVKFVEIMKNIHSIAKIFYFVMGVVLLSLSAVSFIDWYSLRKHASGRPAKMILKLPSYFFEKIFSVIEKYLKFRYFVIFSFLTGFVISLLEFVCTGQIYFPTIMYIAGYPELFNKAVFYLIIYCFAFVVPLIAVFIFVFFGLKSEKLESLLKRHTATVKCFNGIIFAALAFFMFFSLK
ncbi:MAG: hypothetical protein BWY26_00881 [Elusimicrobia bacterium ADurb.Bin231]|nr:MAG: hypothetical protein BWY26_00881 [Elusimicrobia bacterium ADurb.Bin231]